MKRITALALALVLLLSGCGSKLIPSRDTYRQQGTTSAPETTAAPETTEPTTEATTEPTTVPTTEPEVYFDPLNGEILDAPFDGRIYACSVANTNDASIPHLSLYKADVVVESFVNGSVVRCLALFTDLSDVEAIGSTRSTRLMFNDIAEHYNAILSHAGGVGRVIRDANNRGLTHYNVDSLIRQGDPLMQGVAYRSDEYPKQKYGEYNLFIIGPGIMALAESQGVQTSGMPETDYGLVFREDGTPAEGEEATRVTITITRGRYKKDTIMVYDPETRRYVYNQYDKEMRDLATDTPEAFENVVVMYANFSMRDEFHVADFVAGGTGYFACGGKIIPMYWTCDSEQSPFRFFTLEGEPLEFSQGKTYIALTDPDSSILWEGTPVPASTEGETEPGTTVE